MKGFFRTIPLLIYGMLIFNLPSSYAAPTEQQSVQALLTLNLARFTQWPSTLTQQSKQSFKLCVIGDNVVQQSFVNLGFQRINKKPLKLINKSRLRHFDQCHALYINGLNKNTLTQLLLELKNQPILTLGENIDFLKSGGMVALTKVDDKITLNINLQNVKNAKLIISSRILKLAQIFNFPYPQP